MSREPGSAIKIAVLIPCFEKVDALFAYDLAQMVMFTNNLMPEGSSIGILMAMNTYIHQSRQELLQGALDSGATHVLWLDSDMRFPPHAAVKLLQNNVPISGINYSKRRTPADFVAIKRVPREGDSPTDGERLWTTNDSRGLEEVDVIGFGCVLMEAAALVNLPDPEYDPWFWFGKTDHGANIGEDAWFCLKMVQERCNERIFVDHDLSRECAHLGQFEYRTVHAEDTQNALAEARDGTGN